MRLVLDTSVIVAAFRSRYGASRALLDLAFQREVQVIATSALYLEYEMVLKRAIHAEVHGFDDAAVDRFLLLFAGFVDKPKVYYKWRPQLSDADDELVLEAAINGRAEAIVTHNLSDFLRGAAHFVIQTVTPGSILRQRNSL